MKFVRRKDQSEYVEDQTVSIPDGGGSDTVTDVPKIPDTALEVELDNGTVVVLLGYLRK